MNRININKKSVSSAAAAYITATALFISLLLTSCSSDGESSKISSSVSSQSASQSIALSSDSVSSSTSASSKSKTAKYDNTNFENSVFIGNSLVETLGCYGIIDNADFYGRVNLTVKTIFTKSTANGTVPIIDELKKKQYKKVFIMLGMNELGWVTKSFIDAYGKVIDAVKERQPKAQIYIQSILPVSAAVSARNKDETNNARINEINALLKELAQQKNVKFIDPASALKNSAGCLPDEAAADGQHPNKKYCEIWADYLRKNITK